MCVRVVLRLGMIMNNAANATGSNLKSLLENTNRELRILKTDKHFFFIAAAIKERILFENIRTTRNKCAQKRFMLNVDLHMRID